MIAPPTVLAEAIVRSRDDRSILDRDEHGSESVKAFTADPDRLRAAVATLEELGLTVTGVDRVSVAFHGPPAAFTAAFGVSLDYAAPPGVDPEQEVWRLAGAAGGTRFEVARSSRFGGLLHHVLLRSPPTTQAPRTFALTEVTFAGDDVLPDDLLLGEICQTLDETVPARIRTADPFPATDRAGALQATRDTLQKWAGDRLRTELRDHIARTRHKYRVRAMLFEKAVHPEIAAGFTQLCPDPPAPVAPVGPIPFTPTGTGVDEFTKPRMWAGGSREATRTAWVLTMFAAKWAYAAPVLDDVEVAVPSDGSVADADCAAGLGRLWQVLHGGLVGVLDVAEELMAHRDGEVSLLDPARAARIRAALTGIDVEVNRTEGLEALRLWREIEDDVAGLEFWVDEQIRHFTTLWDAAKARLRRHATMVSYAFLAVTVDAVDVTTRVAVQDGTAFWSQPVADGEKWVFSISAGSKTPGGITAADVSAERLVTGARLTERLRRRCLHVIAAGNHEEAPAADAPNLHAVFAEDMGNVLVVGGCVPNAAGWLATEATHGFTVKVPGEDPKNPTIAYELSIPHICATTKGRLAGSVIFPDTPTTPDDPDHPSSAPTLRWWTGGGSSLATPIVAAVCSLVWSAFPDLPARKVKDAVLAGAAKAALQGGQFHIPRAGAADIVPNSNKVTNNAGAKRVMLRQALIEASARSTIELSAGLREILMPATAGSPT